MIRTIARYGARQVPGTTWDILKTFAGGRFIKGSDLHRFEQEFAAYHGVRCAVSASYGRMAFYYILRSLGLPAGSEVLFPALTFWVVPEMAQVAGFRPEFVDIDATTYNMDPKRIESAITERTSAIVPTHLYGQPCDMDPILRLAERYKLTVIEDCAHALGATYRERKVGAFGQAAFFSFQLLKGLNTYGGGMAITDDTAVGTRIRELAAAEPWPSHWETLKKLVSGYLLRGVIHPYIFTFTGFLAFYLASFFSHYDLTRYIWEKIRPLDPLPASYRRRYSNVQAVIGSRLLSRLDQMTRKNQEHADYLTEELKSCRALLTPVTIPNATHVYYQYCVRVSDPATLSRRAIRRGIDVEIMHVDICSGLDRFGPFVAHCPAAESTEKTLQLPVYSSLRPKDIERIVRVVREATADLPPAEREFQNQASEVNLRSAR